MRSMGAVIVLATAPDTPPSRKSTMKFDSLPIPSDVNAARKRSNEAWGCVWGGGQNYDGTHRAHQACGAD